MQNLEGMPRYVAGATLLLACVGLTACASAGLSNGHATGVRGPSDHIAVGTTTKADVIKSLGEASETFVENDTEIWVYRDVVNVPFLVSMIPILGDVADTVEVLHKNCELIIQFDQRGVVKKSKLRNLD